MTSLKWNKYIVTTATLRRSTKLLLWALFTVLQSQAHYALSLNAPRAFNEALGVCVVCLGGVQCLLPT